EENWNSSKVPHTKSSILSPEEQTQDRNEKINWLGNMTLLKSSLNKVLKNAGFETKMIGGGRKKGIKDYATLSITKDDIVKPFENGDKVWNENKIETRTKNLGEEIRKIWG
ncbi:MAG: HNH endonuclease family protein, partial [Candidatus Omnitrophica bacterium]|nr:HNH endonuclease family protein [Candidatus Omnitrophota bacterium]